MIQVLQTPRLSENSASKGAHVMLSTLRRCVACIYAFPIKSRGLPFEALAVSIGKDEVLVEVSR